jgi:hypothetical protein
MTPMFAGRPVRSAYDRPAEVKLKAAISASLLRHPAIS